MAAAIAIGVLYMGLIEGPNSSIACNVKRSRGSIDSIKEAVWTARIDPLDKVALGGSAQLALTLHLR
jgi:hypothetical protein